MDQQDESNTIEVLLDGLTVSDTGDDQHQAVQYVIHLKGTRGAHRGRRTKCNHPGCGKKGHSTSQCWNAHPELRPQASSSRGAREGRGIINNTWNTTNKHTWNALNHDTWDTIERPCTEPSSLPHVPFRFHDLPQELQYQIYEHVYAERYDLEVFMHRSFDKYDNPEGDSLSVHFTSLHGATDLSAVSRRVCVDSHAARMGAFTGHMRLVYDNSHRSQAFDELCLEKWAPLRARVTDLEILKCTERTIGAVNDNDWDDMPARFPQLKSLHFVYGGMAHQFEGTHSDNQTYEWSNMCQARHDDAFRAGRYDRVFQLPVERLKLHHLAWAMELAGRSCEIFLTHRVDWLNNRYCSVRHQVSSFVLRA